MGLRTEAPRLYRTATEALRGAKYALVIVDARVIFRTRIIFRIIDLDFDDMDQPVGSVAPGCSGRQGGHAQLE